MLTKPSCRKTRFRFRLCPRVKACSHPAKVAQHAHKEKPSLSKLGFLVRGFPPYFTSVHIIRTCPLFTNLLSGSSCSCRQSRLGGLSCRSWLVIRPSSSALLKCSHLGLPDATTGKRLPMTCSCTLKYMGLSQGEELLGMVGSFAFPGRITVEQTKGRRWRELPKK